MRDDDTLDELLDAEEKRLLVALYDAWAQQPEAFVFPPHGLDNPTLSQSPPSTARFTIPMARLRTLAEADLISLTLPPPRTRRGSAPGGSVNSTLAGRRYYRRLKEHDHKDLPTQAQSFGGRQDITLPDRNLREQLNISRRQWEFAPNQDPSHGQIDSSNHEAVLHAAPQTGAFIESTGDTEGLDFVSWCGLVLRTLLTLQESSPQAATVGVRLDELARSLFGETEGTTALRSSSSRGQALADAHRDLKSLGLIEDLAGNRFRIPREQRQAARDQTGLWRSICATQLDPDEERILLALNSRSERCADDHASLEPVAYSELYAELGLIDEHGAPNRVERLLADLQTVGLARRALAIGDLTARATYAGLVWDTRRWVMAGGRRAEPSSTMEVDPIWRGRGFPVDERLCFVLMPFRPEFDTIYDDHIKPIVERLPLDCRRADDIYGVRPIMEDVWEQLCQARVVIAELTGRNPNVFYEVGMAHTLGKPVILITQTMDDVPFDLRHLRCIEYEYKPRGTASLERKLEATLRSLLGNPP